ncbi:MAG: DUF2281 domain-containing protein [Candidatus Cloacimonetes bacterium]|nr:DUF2281 domain-containing protein [Candidatus Cloacimonadota bacterium]
MLYKSFFIDSELESRATAILNDLGFDIKDVVDDYLQKIVNSNKNQLMYEMKVKNTNKRPMKEFKGILKGKIWIADDFDEPLDEMKEYME